MTGAGSYPAGLFIPESACGHPVDKLRCDTRSPAGDLRPESVRAVIQCLGCMGFWTAETAPIAVIDRLRALLDSGAYTHVPGHE